MDYLLLFGLVLAVGLIPAFGPPSWLFAVYFHYRYGLSFIPVVLITALATTIGRLLLARITRLIRAKIPQKYIDNLEFSKQLIVSKQKSFWLVLGLFLMSPMPSAQLFEAAGLLNVALIPVGAIFFLGRLVSLSFYLTFAHIGINSLNQAWEAGFNSPIAIASELLTLLFIIALFNMRWIINKLHRKP